MLVDSEQTCVALKCKGGIDERYELDLNEVVREGDIASQWPTFKSPSRKIQLGNLEL